MQPAATPQPSGLERGEGNLEPSRDVNARRSGTTLKQSALRRSTNDMGQGVETRLKRIWFTSCPAAEFQPADEDKPLPPCSLYLDQKPLAKVAPDKGQVTVTEKGPGCVGRESLLLSAQERAFRRLLPTPTALGRRTLVLSPRRCTQGPGAQGACRLLQPRSCPPAGTPLHSASAQSLFLRATQAFSSHRTEMFTPLKSNLQSLAPACIALPLPTGGCQERPGKALPMRCLGTLRCLQTTDNPQAASF